MPYKDPNNYTFIGVLITLMTFLGNAASFAYRILKGEKVRLGIFFAQLVIAIFAGSLVLLGASYYQWSPEFAGAIAGMAGWSGAESIKLVEFILRQYISKRYLR
nr:phage holin family protein [Proteus penneri]